MTSLKILPALGLVLTLAACQPQATDDAAAPVGNAVDALPERVAPAASQVEPAAVPAGDSTSAVAPPSSLAPPPLTDEAEKK